MEEPWHQGAHGDRFARLIDDNPDVAHLLERDEQLLIESAGGLTPEEFRRLCNRWRDLADPDAAYARWRRRHERRHLSMAHDLESNLVFEGRLDGADGEVFFRAVSKRENELFLADRAAARVELGRTPTVGELHRTSAQRRIDALADLVRRGAGATDENDPESDPAVSINYLVDDETVQEGLDRVFGPGDSSAGGPCDRGADTSAAFDPRRCCQTLDGLSVPPEVVIRDAFRARIRRVVFEGASVIIDAGRSRRLLDGPQRDLVWLRDRRCRHPFCTTSHWRCEIDHVVPVSDGGATDLTNAALLCPTHHDDKSAGRVLVRAGPNGRLEWFRPDGQLLGVS